MKKRRLIIRTVILLVLAAAVAYTVYANFTKDEIQKVEMGEKAPDFVLEDMNGKKHRLSEYEGKGVFLNFWATWCKPCEKEMPAINSQYEKFKDQGVEVLTVNVGESKLAVNKFLDRHDLTLPVVIDSNTEVQAAYGINPLPITFLIDKDGKAVKVFKGEMTEEMVKEFMEEIKP